MNTRLKTESSRRRPSLKKKNKRPIQHRPSAGNVVPATAERILEAAGVLFAERGVYGTRVDDIAVLANISKSQLYYHIGNKQQIYELILERHFERLAEVLEKAVVGCEDPIEGLKIIVSVHTEEFKHFETSPRTTAHEFAGGSQNFTPQAYDHYARIQSIIKRFVEKGISSGIFRDADPNTVNMVIAGTLFTTSITRPFLQNLALRPLMRGERISSPDEIAEFVFNVVINYLTSDCNKFYPLCKNERT